jgi:hypothetical protein
MLTKEYVPKARSLVRLSRLSLEEEEEELSFTKFITQSLQPSKNDINIHI